MFGFNLFSFLDDFCMNFPKIMFNGITCCEWQVGTKVTTLGQQLVMNIHTMFGFNPLRGFLEEFQMRSFFNYLPAGAQICW